MLHTDLHLRVPFEDFEERETAERGSKAWLWVAGFCALLLAFCAGLFVHQRLIVPLRDPNTPYEKLPPETAEDANPASTTPAVASKAQPAEAENLAASSMVARAPVVKLGPASVPENDVSQRPKYMAPATIGAPPALMASRLVYAPPPAYPMMAEMTRTQGRVTVEAVVGKDGRVIRAQAIGGHRLLRGAAVREVYGRAVSAVHGECAADGCGDDCDGGFQVAEVGPLPPVFSQSLQEIGLRGGPNVSLQMRKAAGSAAFELLL